MAVIPVFSLAFITNDRIEPSLCSTIKKWQIYDTYNSAIFFFSEVEHCWLIYANSGTISINNKAIQSEYTVVDSSAVIGIGNKAFTFTNLSHSCGLSKIIVNILLKHKKLSIKIDSIIKIIQSNCIGHRDPLFVLDVLLKTPIFSKKHDEIILNVDLLYNEELLNNNILKDSIKFECDNAVRNRKIEVVSLQTIAKNPLFNLFNREGAVRPVLYPWPLKATLAKYVAAGDSCYSSDIYQPSNVNGSIRYIAPFVYPTATDTQSNIDSALTSNYKTIPCVHQNIQPNKLEYNEATRQFNNKKSSELQSNEESYIRQGSTIEKDDNRELEKVNKEIDSLSSTEYNTIKTKVMHNSAYQNVNKEQDEAVLTEYNNNKTKYLQNDPHNTKVTLRDDSCALDYVMADKKYNIYKELKDDNINMELCNIDNSNRSYSSNKNQDELSNEDDEIVRVSPKLKGPDNIMSNKTGDRIDTTASRVHYRKQRPVLRAKDKKIVFSVTSNERSSSELSSKDPCNELSNDIDGKSSNDSSNDKRNTGGRGDVYKQAKNKDSTIQKSKRNINNDNSGSKRQPNNDISKQEDNLYYAGYERHTYNKKYYESDCSTVEETSASSSSYCKCGSNNMFEIEEASGAYDSKSKDLNSSEVDDTNTYRESGTPGNMSNIKTGCNQCNRIQHSNPSLLYNSNKMDSIEPEYCYNENIDNRNYRNIGYNSKVTVPSLEYEQRRSVEPVCIKSYGKKENISNQGRNKLYSNSKNSYYQNDNYKKASAYNKGYLSNHRYGSQESNNGLNNSCTDSAYHQQYLIQRDQNGLIQEYDNNYYQRPHNVNYELDDTDSSSFAEDMQLRHYRNAIRKRRSVPHDENRKVAKTIIEFAATQDEISISGDSNSVSSFRSAGECQRSKTPPVLVKSKSFVDNEPMNRGKLYKSYFPVREL